MKRTEPVHLKTEVLIVGAGGAGMYAALAASQAGSDVLLIDKNMIGRGGATVMAQMTVAAALSEETPDRWEDHLRDTLEAGRGLCIESLAATLCQKAPARMREMDAWGVGWAREAGRIRQVMAPGHGVARCCYVDFLNTGPAVAGTLRRHVSRSGNITRVSDVAITDLVVEAGVVHGAVGVGTDGTGVTVEARAVIIATGGLTRLYQRSSASNNMSGEGYALALRAGAELVDMEFVQFFPIGHLAPRLVGMDPIMWDPFRYKLGGRLLNGQMDEFIDRYGAEDAGRYTATRDLATYAIEREVTQGRGSPNGGAFLSFTHLSSSDLRDAFGPVIDRLADNGIDLTNQAVEVAPIAHYHMGGIVVDPTMATGVDGLFAAGEAVGGAGGANRLSGNAISEAFVFGELAGRHAASCAQSRRGVWDARWGAARLEQGPAQGVRSEGERAPVVLMTELRQLMWEEVGPFRSAEGLARAQAKIQALRVELNQTRISEQPPYANEGLDWYELRAGLMVAEAVTMSAAARTESRGAHQRNDFPDMNVALENNQRLSWTGDQIQSSFAPPPPIEPGRNQD